jgi:predicted Zn finger-like uncharacterized protein
MNITCPKCHFSKLVDPAKLPDRPVRVKCPKCGDSFIFDKTLQPGDAGVDSSSSLGPEGSPPEESLPTAASALHGRRIICSACGTVQSPGAQCVHCGATIIATASPVEDQSYAGFWIRGIAWVIDFLLIGVMQLVLGMLFGLAIDLLGISGDGDPSIDLAVWLFGATLSIGYAVFFTGYCGQTPGKMALRIKVLRADGRPIGYGRAALREIFGKFMSTILLGVGYLMVAFDSRKQGLHDKIADTCVIKL